MNQEQLICNAARRIGLPKTVVTKCFIASIDEIESALSEGESIFIRRFGSFKVTQHKERNGVNPRTLEPIVIPAIEHIKFTAGADLLSKVRGE